MEGNALIPNTFNFLVMGHVSIFFCQVLFANVLISSIFVKTDASESAQVFSTLSNRKRDERMVTNMSAKQNLPFVI